MRTPTVFALPTQCALLLIGIALSAPTRAADSTMPSAQSAPQLQSSSWDSIAHRAGVVSDTLLRVLDPRRAFAAANERISRFQQPNFAMDLNGQRVEWRAGEAEWGALRHLMSESELRWTVADDIYLQCAFEPWNVFDPQPQMGLSIGIHFSFR